jgi:AcrR family transcriptional regulator
MNNDLTDNELSPRERRHQRTHQAILLAAHAIIAEEGINKLSIRAIADRIDYSPASLYEYFGSKEEIVGGVCEQGHRMLKHYLARVDLAHDPADYLVEIGLAYIDFALQNPDYFVLMFSQTSSLATVDVNTPLPAPLPAEMVSEASSFPILLQGVERAVQQRVVQLLPDTGVLETAYALWALVHGASMLQITHLKEFPLDFSATHRAMLRAFVRGLGQ